MTDRTRIEAAARLLSEARRSRRLIDAPPPALAPADAAEAWAVHEALVAELGPVVAWKVGAPDPTADVGIGLITADTLSASPARFGADAFSLWAVEAEVAVTLGADLGPREAPYARDEVFAAVASWHPAIEVLDTAFAHWSEAPALWKMADRQNHGALVVGPAAASAPEGPLDRLAVRLLIDGAPVFAHAGGNTGGDPGRLLVDLANLRRGTDRPLRAGDVVTTGSATPFLKALPGQTVRAEFDGLGAAELVIAA